MNRTILINSLIAKLKAKSYLEIGLCQHLNFDRIVCQRKVGVDPVTGDLKGYTNCFKQTSDEFFARSKEKFDVIFIDGLHEANQVSRDINGALNHLSTGGYIVCHDMNPIKEEHQTVPFRGGAWNGDCWKAFVQARATLESLEMYVIDIDQGCGIIHARPGARPIVLHDDLTYANLEKYRQDWLNLISWDKFNKDILSDSLNCKLQAYVGDPSDPETNFALGLHYHALGQTASAVSFYIRTAEKSSDQLFQYEALLRASMCFAEQGTRGLSVRGLLQRAITILPKRPEAHFLLARWFERENSVEGWVNCYTQAVLAEAICEFDGPAISRLRTFIDYPGRYGLRFERAVSAWWIGQCEESRNLFLELITGVNMDRIHRTAVINNIRFMEKHTGRQLLAPEIVP